MPIAANPKSASATPIETTLLGIAGVLSVTGGGTLAIGFRDPRARAIDWRAALLLPADGTRVARIRAPAPATRFTSTAMTCVARRPYAGTKAKSVMKQPSAAPPVLTA